MSQSRLWGGSSLNSLRVCSNLSPPVCSHGGQTRKKKRELAGAAAEAAGGSGRPANVGVLAMDMYFPKTYVRQVRYGSFGASPRPRSLQLEAQNIACCVSSTGSVRVIYRGAVVFPEPISRR